MPARDPTYATQNYEKAGGSVWHVDGTLEIGSGVVIGTDGAGHATVSGLPAADPHVVNALWSNAGVVTVSAG